MKHSMNKKQFAVAVGNIGRSSKELDGNIQLAAVAAVAFSVIKDRNATPAQQLLEVVNPHVKAAVVAFFEKFGNLAYSKETKSMVFFDVAARTDKEPLAWTDAYADEVMAFAWTTAKKAPEPKSVFDVQEEIDKLIDRLNKAAKKGATLQHAELLARMTATYNKYIGEQFIANAVQDVAALDKAAESETVADNRKDAEIAGM